jgi:RimJ/RimL family protein N-acetyltransferase
VTRPILKITDDRDDHDEMIGVITTHKIDPFPELGYALQPSVWGNGYATEALREYVKHYFDRLTAWVDTENAASVRLMRKTGVRGGENRVWRLCASVDGSAKRGI